MSSLMLVVSDHAFIASGQCILVFLLADTVQLMDKKFFASVRKIPMTMTCRFQALLKLITTGLPTADAIVVIFLILTFYLGDVCLEDLAIHAEKDNEIEGIKGRESSP